MLSKNKEQIDKIFGRFSDSCCKYILCEVRWTFICFLYCVSSCHHYHHSLTYRIKQITPMLHMSVSRPTGSKLITSGATNSGVPCITISGLSSSEEQDKSKKPTLIFKMSPWMFCICISPDGPDISNRPPSVELQRLEHHQIFCMNRLHSEGAVYLLSCNNVIGTCRNLENTPWCYL